ncbi:MAG: family 78 glycoside hydrolase catalytic domain [Prevotella sp.]|nr:family 78 glycoside hydrolase catalytic domain [Prevotella sp.]
MNTISRICACVYLVVFCLTSACAKLVITKMLCNYQSGEMAIVEGKIRLGWQYVDDQGASSLQKSYQIVVHERLTHRLIYDSGNVISDESQLIEIPSLSPNQYGYTWKVRITSHSNHHKKGKTRFSPWSKEQIIRVAPNLQSSIFNLPSPQWIGAITKKDAGIPDGRWSNEVFNRDSFKNKWKDVDTLSTKSIILRKEFKTKKKIVDAVVYVCGLGHYELCINGEKIGDSEFAPLWSEYSKTVYYNLFDVTRQLQSGNNAISVLLGNGFFNVQRGNRYSKLQASFGAPQLFFRMDITYNDRTTEQIFSDGSWKWHLSPITFNSIYGGESYDARLEQEGFDKPNFDDSGWNQAIIVEGPEGKLRPETASPVKVMERFDIQSWQPIPLDSIDAASQKTRRTVDPSAFVCDMGQNLAGFPSISVSGKRGQKITLLVSENLTPQGACDQSQTGRQHYYEYTLKGNDLKDLKDFKDSKDSKATIETWHPRFSYYGFRYIQVEGAVLEGQPNPNDLPVIHNLQSCFIYNSTPETSTFWCNNELFTKTHRLIERAERSNMQAVLSDCPHREKLGWLEQDHLCGPSLLFNYDMTTFIPKIIRDIIDTQKADGMVPTTAPQYVSFGNLFDDSPEWGSTLIILPFMYYDMYGDSTLIADNYEPMKRYVDYLTTRAEDGIVSHGLGDWYDYGPWKAGFSRNTPVPLVATAHYIYDLQLITEAARMTNHFEDEQKYKALCKEVTNSFNKHFYKPDSCYYGSGSQTSNALPLYLGLCGENKQVVLQSLINDIHAHGDRLTTGDVGNRYLFRVLADNGQNELLFKMLNHDETPGYGFQMKQGATTLTEQWDPRQGSSWNHFMLGQIDEWFFRSLAGIKQKPGTHGMRQLIINPQLVGNIKQVKASIQTLYGIVEVFVDKDHSYLKTHVPSGCKILINQY